MLVKDILRSASNAYDAEAMESAIKLCLAHNVQWDKIVEWCGGSPRMTQFKPMTVSSLRWKIKEFIDSAQPRALHLSAALDSPEGAG